jgi:hypothetical protein
MDVATCIVKSTIGVTPPPFSSPWMNCLSRLVGEEIAKRDGSLNGLDQFVNRFISWAALERLSFSESKSAIAMDQATDCSPMASVFDYAFAIAHGFLSFELQARSQLEHRLVVRHDKELNHCGLFINDKPIWSSGPSQFSEEYLIGDSWTLSTTLSSSPRTTARGILVQIGHARLQLSSVLFAKKIVVDDRPTLGGGLPDFWEATIAELISEVTRNPNTPPCMYWEVINMAHKPFQNSMTLNLGRRTTYRSLKGLEWMFLAFEKPLNS